MGEQNKKNICTHRIEQKEQRWKSTMRELYLLSELCVHIISFDQDFCENLKISIKHLILHSPERYFIQNYSYYNSEMIFGVCMCVYIYV